MTPESTHQGQMHEATEEVLGRLTAPADEPAGGAPVEAPKPSRTPTKPGEELHLFGRDHAISYRRGVVAARVSSEEEILAGKHHRVDVDTINEDGSHATRVHGRTVFDPLNLAQRVALVASFPGDKEIGWLERPHPPQAT